MLFVLRCDTAFNSLMSAVVWSWSNFINQQLIFFIHKKFNRQQTTNIEFGY